MIICTIDETFYFKKQPFRPFMFHLKKNSNFFYKFLRINILVSVSRLLSPNVCIWSRSKLFSRSRFIYWYAVPKGPIPKAALPIFVELMEKLTKLKILFQWLRSYVSWYQWDNQRAGRKENLTSSNRVSGLRNLFSGWNTFKYFMSKTFCNWNWVGDFREQFQKHVVVLTPSLYILSYCLECYRSICELVV